MISLFLKFPMHGGFTIHSLDPLGYIRVLSGSSLTPQMDNLTIRTSEILNHA